MSLATEDRHIYSADTARYVPVQRGSTTLFVEKVPRLTIPAEEIATVVLKHRQPDSSSSYDVIFALLPSGARRVAEFTAQQVGRYIEVRFGDTSLGVPRIVAPVGDGTIQGHLSGLPPERVHAAFAGLGSKVTWK